MPFLPGVGPTEMVIIVVAALMIFGPSKLPEVMGQAGKVLRDLRNMTGNLQGEFEKSLNEAAGTDVRKTLSTEIANLKGEVQSATNAVTGATTTSSAAAKTATTTPSKTVTSAPKPAATAAAVAKPGVAAPVVTAPASKDNPLADVSSSGEIAMVPIRTATRRNRAAAPATAPSAAAATATLPKSSSAILPGSGRAAVQPVGAPIADPADPFARARHRRQAAGYQSGPGAQAE